MGLANAHVLRRVTSYVGSNEEASLKLSRVDARRLARLGRLLRWLTPRQWLRDLDRSSKLAGVLNVPIGIVAIVVAIVGIVLTVGGGSGAPPAGRSTKPAAPPGDPPGKFPPTLSPTVSPSASASPSLTIPPKPGPRPSTVPSRPPVQQQPPAPAPSLPSVSPFGGTPSPLVSPPPSPTPTEVVVVSKEAPQISSDDVELSDLRVLSLTVPPRVGDQITLTFTLKNVGQSVQVFEMVFGRWRRSNGSSGSFIGTLKRNLDPGDSFSHTVSMAVDRAGQWSFWPVYLLDRQGSSVWSPNFWSALSVTVAD